MVYVVETADFNINITEEGYTFIVFETRVSNNVIFTLINNHEVYLKRILESDDKYRALLRINKIEDALQIPEDSIQDFYKKLETYVPTVVKTLRSIESGKFNDNVKVLDNVLALCYMVVMNVLEVLTDNGKIKLERINYDEILNMLRMNNYFIQPTNIVCNKTDNTNRIVLF